MSSTIKHILYLLIQQPMRFIANKSLWSSSIIRDMELSQALHKSMENIFISKSKRLKLYIVDRFSLSDSLLIAEDNAWLDVFDDSVLRVSSYYGLKVDKKYKDAAILEVDKENIKKLEKLYARGLVHVMLKVDVFVKIAWLINCCIILIMLIGNYLGWLVGLPDVWMSLILVQWSSLVIGELVIEDYTKTIVLERLNEDAKRKFRHLNNKIEGNELKKEFAVPLLKKVTAL